MIFFKLYNPVLRILAELTPHDRVNAMKHLNSVGRKFPEFLTNKWFVLLGWSMIVLLLMLLVAVRRARLERQHQKVEEEFEQKADQLKLTAEEREAVEMIARYARVKHKTMIFKVRDAFDDGLAQLMQEVFTAGQNLVERKKLHSMIFSIKQKLGYAHHIPLHSLNNRSSKEQTSRQIPKGTLVTISLMQSRTAATMTAEVIQNDEYEFLLRPEIPVLCKPGDIWNVQYHKAALTWEFEAITMACSEKGLALNHSERIRFLNRRRFTRVATKKPAQIASFPIFQDLPQPGHMHVKFVSAELTEIAGPGLRIRTDLPLQFRQRVLVQFELEPGRMIQDIGEVRDIRDTGISRSVIVELIGLDNAAVNELVKVTNRIASRIAKEAPLSDEPQESDILEVPVS